MPSPPAPGSRTLLKVLRRTSVFMVTAALALIAFHLIENVRGTRAYGRWTQDQAAKGRPSDLECLAPPVVPDNDNFAAHPSVRDAITGMSGDQGPVIPAALTEAALFQGWQQGREVDLEALPVTLNVKDLGAFLAAYDSLLAGLEEAANRPHCRLLKAYTSDTIPALTGMRARVRLLCLRAIVRLRNGEAEQGLKDIRTSLRIADHLAAEPNLISQLLRLAILRLTLQPMWEGLSGHRWNDAQLQRLEQDLRRVDLLASWRRAWLFEAISTRHQVAQMMAIPALRRMDILYTGQPHSWSQRAAYACLIPKGWHLQNFLRLLEYHEAQCILPVDPDHHRIDPELSDQAAQAWATGRRSPYTMIVKLGDNVWAKQNRRLAFTQSIYDQAGIACAVERHRLRTGSLPSSLEALEERGGGPLPRDVISGRPYGYRPTGAGRFRLEGSGWNAQAGPNPEIGAMEWGNWAWNP